MKEGFKKREMRFFPVLGMHGASQKPHISKALLAVLVDLTNVI
jgi:hypothetical protein